MTTEYNAYVDYCQAFCFAYYCGGIAAILISVSALVFGAAELIASVRR